MSTSTEKRAFIEELARSNRRSYGTPDGQGTLRALDLIFEHPWVYVFELAQNALDAGARSIAFRRSDNGDSLIFQHDGHRKIGEPEVVGLSKAFRSTKGAAAVGFMGVGFKSVFGRFREARVSGWGWAFRYEMRVIVGDTYGDAHVDRLGAVIPIWDEQIPEPDAGFTTRFELSGRLDPDVDLQSDLAHFLPDDDPTLLAILAALDLERVDVADRVWDLSTSEAQDRGSYGASACSGDQIYQWRIFPVQYEPSQNAIRRFLEHRRIMPDEENREYAAAARPRRVMGVIPLDNRGVPHLPPRGRVYATLPTAVWLPFRLHINADWLLNISRTGLGEIEDDPWQRDIADQIADVLVGFLRWVAQTFSEFRAAETAYRVLALPSQESGGLEAILAEPPWLERLRHLVEDEAVMPVWIDGSNALSFTTTRDAVVPPTPLARAFEQEPELRPATLLKGPVLASHLLGSGGRKLLHSAGLLQEMSPDDLEKTWADGLEYWWEEVDEEETARRDLLFRLWAAVSELTSSNDQSTVNLRCARLGSGTWRSVSESVFLKESLPADSEPGGQETREFMRPHLQSETLIPEGQIAALRAGAGKESKRGRVGYRSRAKQWVEANARGINVRGLVEGAVSALEKSEAPDWSVLVPLGLWASHRNRPDLLVRVLVESEKQQRGVAVHGALLADPYVLDQERRVLFPNLPVVSAAYLEATATLTRHNWRGFFQKAGVKGSLEIRESSRHAGRWQHKRVARFLTESGELSIPTSNDDGYSLCDYDIAPPLPSPDAPVEIRAAVGPWLSDDFTLLREKGRRRAVYHYQWWQFILGQKPSAWVCKLSELEWVPCSNGKLMRPRDVLPRHDPSRAGAPVASLSDGLVSLLEQEGLTFGEEIPEASALRRFLTIGSQIPSEELAVLLREVRDEVSTDEDQRRFGEALLELQVPSDDGGRFPLTKIVRRVGGGQLRGTLGGSILPLDRLHEHLVAELEHDDFPYQIPETTTGDQALDYLHAVWRRAQSSPKGLANEVRDVLPNAYVYCLRDCTEDPSLLRRWEAAVPEAVVFVDREWVMLARADDIYFDDVDDRRFIPESGKWRIASAGHLGNSPSDQRRTAEALGLRFLSSSVKMEWSGGTGEPVADDVALRFDLICELLRSVRGTKQADSEPNASSVIELRKSHDLALKVRFGAEAAEEVPVNARLHDNKLKVKGRPPQFGSDAAKELLRNLSFRQQGELACDLTGMLTTIEANEDFPLAADKFRRSFARGFALPPWAQVGLTNEGPTEPGHTVSGGRPPTRSPDVADGSSPEETTPDTHVSPADLPRTVDRGELQATNGSFTRDRALGRSSALMRELKNAATGEIAPPGDEEKADEYKEDKPHADGSLGDELYREIAARYERECGRIPEIGKPGQTGWDLRSVDPETGVERLIEVKGKGCAWVEDEVIALSRAQVHKAFEMGGVSMPGRWFLYVVERLEDGGYQVLPIENPVRAAGKWILCGELWREIAVEPREIKT